MGKLFSTQPLALEVVVDVHLSQAQLLLQTKRYADAERALRQALLANPNHDAAHAWLAYTLYQRERLAAALGEAETALGLAPDVAFNHYVRALILSAQQQLNAARTAIGEAIRLDPQVPGYYGLLGTIYVRRKDWERALATVEKGLQINPQHTACLNLRGRVLLTLDRGAEAEEVIATALARDPENAFSHANQGWLLLQRGEHKAALTYFREALRIDPLLDWAREGVVEALKARNFIYRLMLRYSLWMSRWTTGEQFGIMFGVMSVKQALNVAAVAFWPLYIIVLPLNILYSIFVALTWVASPLFALLLRFDRFGRLALSKAQMTSSNWMALCLFFAELGVLLSLIFHNLGFLTLTPFSLALLLPLAGVFNCAPGKRRVILILYTLGLTLLALLGVISAVLGSLLGWSLALACALLFMLLWPFYPLLANWMLIVRELVKT